MAVTFSRTSEGKTFDYTPSKHDMLWLGVAAYGETHGRHDPTEWGAMMWVWLNRFMLFKNRSKWPTLAKCVQNHSQPVNPIWRRTGYKCAGKPETGHCGYSRLQWRDKMARFLNRKEIPSSVKGFVPDFVDGKVAPPGGGPWLDFANNKVAQRHGTRLYGGNYYLSFKQLQNTSLLRNFFDTKVHGYVGGVSLYGIGVLIGLSVLGRWIWKRLK